MNRNLRKTVFNFKGKNQMDLVCPPEFANVPLKFRQGDTRNLNLGTTLHVIWFCGCCFLSPVDFFKNKKNKKILSGLP